ncbi:MAG: hypothetical protein JNL11_19830 [Bdellovibrionaceae bacterium]|nr:hypothetical protein [Pseudobdellovibrionaceae bacterium]
MKKLNQWFFYMWLPFFISCADSKLPKYVELNELRVLSLIADKPEVNPSELVSITPIISDINENTALTFEAFGCIDLGVSLGAEPSCHSNPTKVSLSQGTITSATNAQMAQNFTGTAPAFTAFIPPASSIFSQRSSTDQTNGIGYLIEYKISNSRGQSVNTIKRILVSNKSNDQKNLNPVIDQFQSNGATIGVNDFPLNGVYKIALTFDATSFQTYRLTKDDGSSETQGEQLTTTWFITDGSLKYFRSMNQDSNEYTAPAALPGNRKSFLISISRDSRGGAVFHRICGGC